MPIYCIVTVWDLRHVRRSVSVCGRAELVITREGRLEWLVLVCCEAALCWLAGRLEAALCQLRLGSCLSAGVMS